MSTHPPFSRVQRRRFYTAALGFVAASRRVILRKMTTGFRKRLKADASYVTDADLAAERVLRHAIAGRFPGHGIIGEEFPPTNPGSDFQWILDPIDGTLSFTHGIPFFGTIIGLHHRGRPLVGIIDHPALGLCYSAGAGLGCYRNGRRVRIRPPVDLEREVIATGDRGRFVACRRARSFDDLMREHPQVRAYADCLGHTLAAEGSVGAMVDYGVRLWDIAATRILVEEAGGRYVQIYRSRRAEPTIYGIICGKPAVVKRLLPIFRGGSP